MEQHAEVEKIYIYICGWSKSQKCCFVHLYELKIITLFLKIVGHEEMSTQAFIFAHCDKQNDPSKNR